MSRFWTIFEKKTFKTFAVTFSVLSLATSPPHPGALISKLLRSYLRYSAYLEGRTYLRPGAY